MAGLLTQNYQTWLNNHSSKTHHHLRYIENLNHYYAANNPVKTKNWYAKTFINSTNLSLLKPLQLYDITLRCHNY